MADPLTFTARRTFKSVWEILTNPEPEPPVMIAGLLREGSTLVIGGSSGVGKSLFSTQFGWCLSTGRDFLDMHTHRAYNVLYAQAEMAEWDVEERLRKQGDILNIPRDEWEGTKYHYLSIQPWSWKNEKAWLEERMDEMDCEVLILDPLSRIKPSDTPENDNDKVSDFLNFQLNELRVRKNLKALILVHHFGKPGNGEGAMRDPLDLLRGASALRDWMENFIYVGGKRHAPDAKLVFDKIRGFAPKPELHVNRTDFIFREADDIRPFILTLLSDFKHHNIDEITTFTSTSKDLIKAELKKLPVIYLPGKGYTLDRMGGEALLAEEGILWDNSP
jgi:hypothetical protein